MQAQANTRVNFHNAKCKPKRKRQRKKWKTFHFLVLALGLFHRCEQGQRKRKVKSTRAMPLRFTFKPRWRPPPPSLISFPESSFTDCWSGVMRTLGTRLPPSWDTEMRVRISFYLRLLLRLCRTCEPAFRYYLIRDQPVQLAQCGHIILEYECPPSP